MSSTSGSTQRLPVTDSPCLSPQSAIHVRTQRSAGSVQCRSAASCHRPSPPGPHLNPIRLCSVKCGDWGRPRINFLTLLYIVQQSTMNSSLQCRTYAVLSLLPDFRYGFLNSKALIIIVKHVRKHTKIIQKKSRCLP